MEEKEKLIKYLEDKIKGINKVIELEQNEEPLGYLLNKRIAYQDILERIKSGKYE